MNTLHISNLRKTPGKTCPGTATLIGPYGMRTYTNAKRMWEACGGLRGGLERREQNGGVQDEVAICGCFELFD